MQHSPPRGNMRFPRYAVNRNRDNSPFFGRRILTYAPLGIKRCLPPRPQDVQTTQFIKGITRQFSTKRVVGVRGEKGLSIIKPYYHGCVIKIPRQPAKLYKIPHLQPCNIRFDSERPRAAANADARARFQAVTNKEIIKILHTRPSGRAACQALIKPPKRRGKIHYAATVEQAL